MPANQLIHETSPYLLQHAHNPVNWYPWGAEALERARRENKLIFLSIGYAACHWCHVMEHESFENDEVAELLNRDFISIKVDREERPDLDEIYMNATMLYSGGQGGWPMSVWLTPALKPVFAGTYFPPENHYGRPGFKALLEAIAQAWREKPQELAEQAEKVVGAMASLQAAEKGEMLAAGQVSQMARRMAEAYDPQYGGLASGGSNKFPPSMSMDLLLRVYRKTGDRVLLGAVENTLEKMGNGGIYDHLGGGIHRYSTDVRWLVPHFEKMLYDQALVSSIYLDGYQVTGHAMFAGRARGIFDYVLRDLASPEGGFYSSEDADSEGLEGKFYIWTLDEVQQVLGAEDAALFASHYDVTEWGNWDHPGDEHVPGGPKNILQEVRPIETIAKLNRLDAVELEGRFAEMRRKMLEARSKRVRPGLDDKILAGWNGLMIAALAKGAAVLDEPRYGAAAGRAADFLLTRMVENGRLLATFGKGKARLKAYITDYAFLIEGLLALYEWSGEWRRLEAAARLADTAIEYYWDKQEGGFFFTASDHEQLIQRSKVSTDSAIPSGNSVMLSNLERLAELLGRNDLRDRAAEIVRLFSGAVEQHPFAYDRMLAGIEAWHDGFVEVAILGPKDDPGTRELRRTVYRSYLPNKVVVQAERADDRLPLLAGRGLIDGHPTVYVCRDYVCRQPTTSPAELAAQLGFATDQDAAPARSLQ
ncbi:MAG TPA: thioredoxin domain-containing protein [Bryobacterales bacterium]|nr:thioredoxin domain-containing protein [Bryobacterales bacterium]